MVDLETALELSGAAEGDQREGRAGGRSRGGYGGESGEVGGILGIGGGPLGQAVRGAVCTGEPKTGRGGVGACSELDMNKKSLLSELPLREIATRRHCAAVLR